LTIALGSRRSFESYDEVGQRSEAVGLSAVVRWINIRSFGRAMHEKGAELIGVISFSVFTKLVDLCSIVDSLLDHRSPLALVS
jgi:hypothetical protein